MACPSYQAGFAMEDERDSVEIAFEDTCYGGSYLGDEILFLALTSEATNRAIAMHCYSVKNKKKGNEKFLKVVRPGFSYERNLVITHS